MSKRTAIILSAIALLLNVLLIGGVVIYAVVSPPRNPERFAGSVGGVLGFTCLLIPFPWLIWAAVWFRDRKKKETQADDEEERPVRRRPKRARDD